MLFFVVEREELALASWNNFVWRYLRGSVAERDGDTSALNDLILYTIGRENKNCKFAQKSLKMLRVAKANLFEAPGFLAFKAAVAVSHC